MEKRFTDIFIKRPVFATCISLAILLTGMLAFLKMDVRLYPKIDSSIVNISISYPGASSEVMEGFVATPVEQAVSAVDGIDYITSSSIQGSTTIMVNLKLGYDADIAANDITNKVASIRSNLPQDIYDPVIDKQSPDYPLMWFDISSSTMNDKELTDYLIRVVQPKIQTIEGVSDATIYGGREYAMRIWLDPYKMAARNVTASDIYNTVQMQNVLAPAGSLKSQMQKINLYSSTDLKTAQQFNDIVIHKDDSGHMVRIKDIGESVLGAKSMDYSSIANGHKTIFMAVSAKPNANILDVEKDLVKILPQIKENLPSGTNFNTFFDSTKFIKVSIKEVSKTVIEACIFVFLVIFLMIGSLRAVLIPLVTIPLSLAGACIIMLALNFTINTMTLLAFVLAIGLVVDDAIVVLENVHRHLEEGLSPKESAIIGAREISFAIIAMTLTLAAVYAPIGFMSGLIGQLFTEFAFTLAGAVLFSGFIALTLSPMMCSKIYKSGENLHAGLAGYSDKFFDVLREGYKRILHVLIKFRYVVIIAVLVIYAGAFLLYAGLQHELAPDEDQGVIFSIVQAPGSANLDYTIQRSAQLAPIYKKLIPEMDGYMIVDGYPFGVNSALSLINLKDWDKRKRTAMQIRNTLLGPVWSIPGVEAFPTIPPTVPGTGGYTPVEVILSSLGSYEDLEKISNKFVQEIRQWGGVVNITNDLKIDQPQVNIDIDRDKAADLGIKMADISQNLNTFLSQAKINYFSIGGRSYEVLSQLYRQYRDIPDALNILNVRTKSGELIPLSNVVNLNKEVIPESRNHFQQLRAATIKGSLAPGVSLGTALSHLTNLAKTTLPHGIGIDYAHESRQYIQTAGTMGILFIFALIFIYLVLAAQFESFRDPFVIMLTVPLAFSGALLGIYLCHGTLNIYTNIGLLTLVGLITKNGILIVEFANQQQRRGVAFIDAIISGATTRLRPILMTTAAIILGAFPLAAARGAGAVSRTQMGFVIIFGMAIGTCFTLFIIPIMYYFLASKLEAEEE